jgi:ABC-2 type transport system ATP-binding protein
MNTAEPLVDVVGLAKRFAGQTVVDGVTLRVRRGEIVGLVGANGGGKTTTLRMLAGLLHPDSGDGEVLGRRVGDATAARRRATGYMSQRLALYADLTVDENLRFHAEVHDLPDAASSIAASVARHRLAAVVDTRFGTLSGGWARRVQFATTVLHSPPLLLLDEPTAGLDVTTRRAIWGWLAELAVAGTGIVISTHDLQEAERCPQVLLYHQGHAGTQTTPALLAAAHGATSLEDAVAHLGDV